jgi:hypothetical protein
MVAAAPPSLHPSGGGAPLALWIILACIAWLALQWRPSRRAVWRARVDALSPIGLYLIADVMALFAPVIHRKEIRRARGELDRGIDDFLN